MSDPRPPHRIGIVEIDPTQRSVHHAERAVAVEPKPFDLLLYLIEHADRVVRREELMEALWPGVVVSEATLSSAVRRARYALGPERERLRVLRRVGYRFIAPAAGQAHEARAESLAAPVGPDQRSDAGDMPYVGRSVEIGMLHESLARGLAGRGCFISVGGDAGAGKSRTAAELARRAQAIGAEVIQARCYEGDGGQPLWPWVQVFRSLAGGRQTPQRIEILGAEARDIALLTAAAVGAETAPPPDPEMQRIRLFDSAVTVLRRSARSLPLLLVLDDLHWADAASILLLRALVDEIADVPIVVVGTHREMEVDAAHPLALQLATLRRQRAVRHVHLGNLAFSDVATLLNALAGGAIDDSIVVAVHAATEGNPLFVREYWYDLVETQAVARCADGWQAATDIEHLGIPTTVSEIIGRRLQRLPREATQVLAVAAIIGRDFTYELVQSVTGLAPDDVIGSLDAATAAGIVEDAADPPGCYRFTHALVRQTLYEGMTPMRRAALHRAVAEALRSSSPATPGPDRIAELAHHFLKGAPVGTHDAAVDYAIQAAQAATRACGYEDAVRHLREAIAVWDARNGRDSPPDLRRRCELQLLLAEALGRAGEGVAMRAAFEEATTRAHDLPAPELMARAAIGMTAFWVAEDETAVRRLEAALAALPAEAADLRARTSARLAKTLYLFANTRTRRENLCAEARALALEAANPNTMADVLADSLEALFHGDSLPQQDELVAALGDAADMAGDKRQQLVAGAWRIVNAMRHGQLNEADVQLAAFSRMAQELRQPRFLHHAASFDAALLLARAKLDEAEARIAETLALGERIDADVARWIHWVHLYHLRAEQGRLEEFLGEGLALRLPPATMGALSYQRTARWAAPHVFCELGREDEARASFKELMAGGLDALPPENARNVRIPVLFALGSACLTLGDESSAAPLYDHLAPYADQWHVVAWGSVVHASTHMMLGTLSGVQRRWALSAEHFAEASRQHASQNAIRAQARLLCNHAQVILRRGRRIDRQHAAQMIEEGVQLARAHGLHGILQRLQRLGV